MKSKFTLRIEQQTCVSTPFDERKSFKKHALPNQLMGTYNPKLQARISKSKSLDRIGHANKRTGRPQTKKGW